jgi:hypothetical protein
MSKTRNADENSSVIELMREFIATEEKTGPTINNDLVSVVNIGLMKRANQDKLKELSKKNIPSHLFYINIKEQHICILHIFINLVYKKTSVDFYSSQN